jgi:XapX domain-containing protein
MWEAAIMKPYLVSLGAGLLVGIVYSLLNVRSPAPPVVALVGLLGILAGEQIIPVAKRMVEGSHLAAAWRQAQCMPHIFGLLPGRHSQAMQAKFNFEPRRAHGQGVEHAINMARHVQTNEPLNIRPLKPEKTYEKEQ